MFTDSLVGVDFRFTDVRQIFYNQFGGIEPKLLQLTHNYRSHAGVLRLAACVVELLYFFFSNSLDKLPPDLGLFNGPRPVCMEVASTEELVLMLDGAKRETSRIEFGAHQVVIVRSEEAKRNLPDEFGVDKDWVMTVQESKGLEFDDVLLYNFFTDSPAGGKHEPHSSILLTVFLLTPHPIIAKTCGVLSKTTQKTTLPHIILNRLLLRQEFSNMTGPVRY